ncbi:hypothetical protein ASG29_06215 [Sphingomonas sp. Leaf412]|uniref:type II toxin-antitoxin system VapC family toxin n=1 Tax=Sphingomonas sp. Leaf412 TaxID=1736370 RepID=UPI0006FC4324|nr:type II toxin-antitoxin system VapC family toxin [Sphingomonas sp. Leaf412]KQT33610.1 hypothetical protein ASG29_06215 [Sphingomonas sp. Leaf412]
MLVVDASVVVKALTREVGTEAARALIFSADDILAPSLVTLEVAGALSKKVRYYGLPIDTALTAMGALPEFISEYVPTDTLIERSLRLSVHLSHAIQDCVYLALAIERNCILATSDLKFAGKVRAGGLGLHLVIPGEPL